MKIKHILTEDVRTEKRLDLIADALLDAIKESIQSSNVKSKFGKLNSVGTIGELVFPGLLGEFKEFLSPIRVAYTFDPEEEKVDGVYYSQTQMIVITHPKAGNRVMYGLLHSTLVHELRHAVDDMLSQGKALVDKRAKRSSSPSPDEEDGEYFRYPHEINARASEAMLLVKRYLMRAYNEDMKIDSNLIKTAIIHSLEDKHLVKVFKSNQDIPFDNKDFKKLFNRMYKYAEDFLEQLYAAKGK